MRIYIKDIEDFNKRLMVLGYSKSSFAEKLGISNAYVYSIANGRNISAKLAKKICIVLNCNFNDIFLIKKLTKVSISEMKSKGA